MLKDYYIGEIDVSTIPNTTKSCAVAASSKQLAHDPDKSFQFFLKTLQFVIPIAIFSFAVILPYFSRMTQ
jgi:hypothetical protein